MSDKELLELAAKAADIKLEWSENPDEWLPMYCEGETYHYFDPLNDDGDALRLAVKLMVAINITPSKIYVSDGRIDGINEVMDSLDPHAATRRAIVRAAAEIGRAK